MISRLVIELPEDLKKRLKTYCAANGKTMHDEVLSILCRNLEAHEKVTKEDLLKKLDVMQKTLDSLGEEIASLKAQ